ncbi:MAG TPA: L,D-transpeptidase family protein [Solirubrobacteraceae bacterium]|jgi:peptidoglycan hydrolase-like protein with peptidoglycan-binding domain|nr:L,D-transpeptidase family protein [Solirubrobacteraceae bacterium]
MGRDHVYSGRRGTRGLPRLAATLAALGVLAATPAPAFGEAPTSVPPPGPLAGTMRLVLQKVGGSPPFALVGSRIVVRGSVSPYVAGQTVDVGFYLEGRKVAADVVSVLSAAGGAGSFRVAYSSHYAGLLQVRAMHAATAQQAAFSARSPGVRLVHANLGPGAHNQSVRLLQSELDALHYAVPLTGVFDEGTGQALIAYRKMTGLERVAYAGTQVFKLLARRAGSFHVRYPHDGRHVEANLTKQVLAEIEPGGRVRRIYTTSSGKPSTPTVIGRFQVYEKTPGENSEGMVDSNYFIRGYAIHGYAEVPTYAASHGCLRVPIPDAPSIYEWVRDGTPVDVYNEGAGGSARVRANAGP